MNRNEKEKVTAADREQTESREQHHDAQEEERRRQDTEGAAEIEPLQVDGAAVALLA
jgi:hypothetical protein